MKITIIGAGSTYTPELMEGLIRKRGSLAAHRQYLPQFERGE